MIFGSSCFEKVYIMEKKYKIHEVAEYLGLTPTAIRHYEQKGLIHIEKDPDNGYRMFSDEDMYKYFSDWIAIVQNS